MLVREGSAGIIHKHNSYNKMGSNILFENTVKKTTDVYFKNYPSGEKGQAEKRILF